MADDDRQIRDAVKTIIQPAYPAAVIFPWNALSHNLGDWPGLFRVPDGSKVHGWIIKRAAAAGEWKNIRRTRQVAEYDVWGFYSFRTGKASDNSDDEFGLVTDAAYDALAAKPTLDLDGVVDKHDLLQYQRITTLNCGEETLHFAQGRLRVHLCC
jgi:hypothetical protein